jgi:MoaA/NifB/PqqE/SkfB family radical SAM enzyme
MKCSRVFGYPRHIMIDLVNVCGLKCPICAQGRGEIPRKPSQMSEDLFRSIINCAGPYLYTLTLTNWGEPLKHPKALDFMRYARKFPIYIGFSTNMMNMPENLDELLETGIDEIGCSIDGATPETYRKYRIGGDFQVALNNMRKLVERKHQLSLTLPKIRWQVLLNRYTEKEIARIKELALEIGVDSLVFVPIYVDIARMLTHSSKERFERDRDWLPEDQDLSWYDYSIGDLKVHTTHCEKLWDSMVIHPDGAVSPCCAVIDPKDDFGVLTSGDDISSVWNGPAYRSARRLMAGHKTNDTHLVCRHCHENGVVIF